MIDLISSIGLLSTVTAVGNFFPKLICEFVVNLLANLNNHGTLDFHKVHVRGKCFNLSPALLNSFFNIVLPTGFFCLLPSLENLL